MTHPQTWIAWAGLAALAGCAPPANKSTHSATICAAASLLDVVSELAAAFEDTRTVKFRVNAGASGALCTQIELGAPCDLFLSADPALIDRLERGGYVVPESRRVLAVNRLVVALAAPFAATETWPTGLTADACARIAIADPDAAPAGRYAREALQSAGIWDELEPKLVRTPDVRSAARYLALRAVNAAIIYRTDTIAVEGIGSAFDFDERSHTPIEYVGAVVASVRRPESSRTADAGRFLDFVVSDDARPLWRSHGFEPPADVGRPETP